LKKALSVILTIGFLIGLMTTPVFALNSDNKKVNNAYIITASKKAKPLSSKDTSLKLKQNMQMVKSHFAIAMQKLESQKKSQNAEQINQKAITNDSKNVEKPKTR